MTNTLHRLLAVVRYHTSPPSPRVQEAQASMTLYPRQRRQVMAVPSGPVAVRRTVGRDA